MAVTRVYRYGQAADVAALVAIDASTSLNPWTAKQLAAACDGEAGSRAWMLVVETGGLVAGFAALSSVLDEVSILSIAISPQQQRQGLGQSLLQAALERAGRAGAIRCLLEVRESNVAARHLYTRNGFVLDGVRKNYYPADGGREDALLMSKQLEGTANECA